MHTYVDRRAEVQIGEAQHPRLYILNALDRDAESPDHWLNILLNLSSPIESDQAVDERQLLHHNLGEELPHGSQDWKVNYIGRQQLSF